MAKDIKEYQVGNIQFLKDDDLFFDTQEEAEEQAIADSYDDGFHGVYETKTGNLLAIVYQQEIFEK